VGAEFSSIIGRVIVVSARCNVLASLSPAAAGRMRTSLAMKSTWVRRSSVMSRTANVSGSDMLRAFIAIALCA
jgi:hypothetical protein